MKRYDVVVLGGGPAALAAAAAFAGSGLAVARVDPDPVTSWTATYAAWADELAELDLDAAIGHRWDEVTVIGGQEHHLGRAYVVFDDDALAGLLLERAAEVTVVQGRVVGANHDRRRSTAVLHDGRFLDATVLVDATGHRPALVLAEEVAAAAGVAQAAFGVVARCSPAPFPAGSCVLMDWSYGSADDADPTFLYALDLGDGWWLLEETSLARRPPLARAALEERLRERLAASGVVLGEVRRQEEVLIPLGRPLPSLRQRSVGFGAAAGLVHPATGYSVGASLRAAPVLAEAIVAALDRRATPAGVAAAAWSAVWPADRRRARMLERYGLAVSLRFDLGAARTFFDQFFSLPDDQWFGYLTGTASSSSVASTMGALFRAAPLGLKARLATGNPLALRGVA